MVTDAGPRPCVRHFLTVVGLTRQMRATSACVRRVPGLSVRGSVCSEIASTLFLSLQETLSAF